ncbi:oligosaccharide flippase family protein [Sphingomonas jaspsi]|uniref:oligosaccharide flippase family protein n=1 Tax=Sphingomonas jaspsi TaxID=392409 RepID=UPI0005654AB4|nr:oligosaccharide flippase family protein [Sphingomonas jaspsi]
MAVTDRLRNRLFRNSGVATGLTSLGLRVAGLGAAFALGVVLARTLGPAEFGIYGLVVAIGALGMTIATLGTPQLAVREFGARLGSERQADIPGLAKSYLSATLLSSVGIAILAVTAAFFIDPTALGIVLPGAVAIPFLAVTALIAAQLRGLGAMGRGQVMDIVVRPVMALGVIGIIAIAGWALDARTALWVQAAVAAITALVSVRWLTQRLPPVTGKQAVSPWLRIALPLCMVDLLRQFDGTYGSMLLGWASSDVELGLYRAAVSCSVVASMPVTILHIIYAPQVSKLVHDGKQVALQKLLARIAAIATALVSAVTLGCLLLGRPLINLVFGPAYDGSWAPLTILCIAQLAFAWFGMGPILLAMGRRERQLTRIYLFAIAIAVVASSIMVARFGAIGAAVGQLVSLALIGGLSWLDGRRRLGVDSSVLGALRH